MGKIFSNLNRRSGARRERERERPTIQSRMGARERFARRSIARSLLSSSFNTIHAKNTPKTSLMRAFVAQGRKGAIVDGAIDDSRRRTFSSVGASTSGRDVASNESGSRRGVTDASNNGGRRRGNDDSRLARRTFASEASQHLPNKNAAASTTREEIRDDDDDDDEKKKKKKAEDDAFDDTDDEKDDAENEDSKPPFGYRGNKAGQISRNPGKRGGQGEFSGRKMSSKYKPMTSKTQLDGMNCEQLLDEIKQRFQTRKKPFLGGGNVPTTGEKGHWTERESATVEIEGFKHEISERLSSFLGFGEGESGVKATRRFVDRRLKSYCEKMNLFVGESEENKSGMKVKRKKDPENPGKWEERRIVLDTKLKALFQTSDGIDQLAFRKRTKADEKGDFVDGIPPVSMFLDPHFLDITNQDASSQLAHQSKTHGSKVVVKNNRLYAVRESALKMLLQRVRSPKDVQFALEAVALFHMERSAIGKIKGLGFERAYEFMKACCDVKSYETALWACEQSRSLGLNLSRKTLSLLLWHLLEANRPLEEVLRVYSVIRNLKLGVDAKTAQFVVKSALQHGHVNAAAGYCVQFMQAGVKVNRKTPTAIMNAAIEHNLPNAAIAVERSWNKEQPQLPKAPFDRLALAQAYALLADEDECIRAAKSILDTLDDSFSEEFKNSTSQKLALWPQKLLIANEAKGGASKEILERCQRGMELIKSACEGKLFADVDVAYAFSSLQIPEEEEIEEEDVVVDDEKREE